MENIIIKIENSINFDKWNEFILKAEGGTFFSFLEYYKIQKAKIFFVVAYDGKNNIVGGIIARIRCPFFPLNVFAKSIWVESGILFIKNNDCDKIKVELLLALEKEAKKRKCIFIHFNHWCREMNSDIFLASNYEIICNATFIIDLTKTNSELFSHLSKGNKAAIKKAQKNALKFFISKEYNPEILNNFYNLYSLTLKRALNINPKSSLTLKSKNYLIQLLKSNSLPSYFFAVYNGDKIASAAFIIEKSGIAYYYIGASDILLNRKYGASNFLLWEIMMWAKNNGIKYFDFGGVPCEPKKEDPAFGVYNFKKSFGGKLIYYYSGYKKLYPFRAMIFNYFFKQRNLVRFFYKNNN